MMFKSTAIFLTLTAALELVLASSVSITSPEANAIWEAGSIVEIKWDVKEAASGPIRIQYASGPSQSLTVNGLIADNVVASNGKYSWKIPADIKPKKYVIEAGPSDKDLSFAGYITIKNKNSTTTKKTTKKTPVKPTKKTTKKVTKKSTTKKAKHSAVCIGYPVETDASHEKEVRCHSVPRVESQQKKSKKAKKTTKKSTKKSTKPHKKSTKPHKKSTKPHKKTTKKTSKKTTKNPKAVTA